MRFNYDRGCFSPSLFGLTDEDDKKKKKKDPEMRVFTFCTPASQDAWCHTRVSGSSWVETLLVLFSRACKTNTTRLMTLLRGTVSSVIYERSFICVCLLLFFFNHPSCLSFVLFGYYINFTPGNKIKNVSKFWCRKLVVCRKSICHNLNFSCGENVTRRREPRVPFISDQLMIEVFHFQTGTMGRLFLNK